MTDVSRTVLPNGIVVLSERMPHVKSGTLGIWLRAGSRHEPPSLNGITHVVEHMLFKGTTRRSARQIAVESDQLGGHVDAFTMRECTGFHIQTIDSKFDDAFDLLADIVSNPVFDPEEFEREKSVILEEMSMVEDTPDELVFEKFTQHFWPDDALGRPIEGTRKTVRALTSKKIGTYHDTILTGPNIVVAAAGNIGHEQVLALTNKHFGNRPSRMPSLPETSPKPTVFLERIKKGTEQTQLVIGMDCPSLVSEKRHAAGLLSAVLGGGLSSRLFQRIREREGLAYNTFSDVQAFHDVGCLTIYAALSAQNLLKAVGLILDEMKTLIDEPVPDDELQRAKDQFLAGMLLSLESSAARAGHLGRQEIVYRKYSSLDDLTREIQAVKSEEIQALAAELFRSEKLACAVLGPMKPGAELTADMLKL